MKKIYLMLSLLLVTAGINAQYIYNDFDANQNEAVSGWPNEPTVIANPDPTGINTSAQVGSWTRTEEQWAHILLNLEGTIDFTTGEIFHIKIWSPVACNVLFKLEHATNSGVFVEVSQSVTTPNVWVQLDFDFSGSASATYSKIVIFPDFSATADNIFYIDDIEGPGYSGGAPGDPVTLPVTFEDENVEYGLTDFGGNASEIVTDPEDENNKVAKTIKTAGAETWAGTTVGGVVGFPTEIPFTPDATTMTVDVWSPQAGIVVRLKVEDSGDSNISVETDANTTVSEAWETITFDFSNEATGTAEINFDYQYNKASIFFNFGVTGAQAGEKTYYWDNMEFVGGAGEKPLLALDVQDNFENNGYATIDSWKFQDPDLEDLIIGLDPVNATNHVADYNRSGSFEWTNAQFILDHRMDLTNRNIFEMSVYFPSTNDYSGNLTPTAALKLQNSLLGPDAWTTQTEVKLEVTEFDSWVVLSFDFSQVANRQDYDQVVVQFGGEGHFVPGLFYFDDIHLLQYTGVNQQTTEDVVAFPNPAGQKISWKGIENTKEVAVFSITGSLVYQGQPNSQYMDVSFLEKGLYVLRLTSEDGLTKSIKFIKE